MTGQNEDAGVASWDAAEPWLAPCPRYDGPAEDDCHEESAGSVNLCLTVICGHCGFRSGFDWWTP
jgi:hypothetical protein